MEQGHRSDDSKHKHDGDEARDVTLVSQLRMKIAREMLVGPRFYPAKGALAMIVGSQFYAAKLIAREMLDGSYIHAAEQAREKVVGYHILAAERAYEALACRQLPIVQMIRDRVIDLGVEPTRLAAMVIHLSYSEAEIASLMAMRDSIEISVDVAVWFHQFLHELLIIGGPLIVLQVVFIAWSVMGHISSDARQQVAEMIGLLAFSLAMAPAFKSLAKRIQNTDE